MKKIFALFSLLIIILLFNHSSLKSDSYFYKYNKKYFAIAYNHHSRKVPSFEREIKPRYLYLFKKYYVVYYLDGNLHSYRIYENKKLFSRTIYRSDYVLHERFDENGHRILYQKLYYDSQNRLYREENYVHHKLFTYYIYLYGADERVEYLNIYSSRGDLVTQLQYYYDSEGSISKIKRLVKHIPYGGESEQAMLSQWPKLYIRDLKIISNRKYKTRRIRITLYNGTDSDVYNISISADLYDSRGHLIDSISGKSMDGQSLLPSGTRMYIESSETRYRFTRIRLFIHYSYGQNDLMRHKGPMFFTPIKRR